MSTSTESMPLIYTRVPRAPRPALPSTKTLQKRPLLHPPISSASSAEPKVFYISASSSHAAIIKRVNKQLNAFAANAGTSRRGNSNKRQKLGKKPQEGVTLKATGKGITNAVILGTKFMDMGCEVRVTTGSIKIVDDVVDALEEVVNGKEAVGEGEKNGEDEEVADMHVRTNSTVEVFVWRKEVEGK
ncbi:Rpp20 subunit of nuclear RNase MRP and P-domain-containing protein [Tricharina praecox]|uniref:Rpp20 subunit of nuclear RNase MRP and P-domain-containing protein n=1 Tax=Tricharina praecox TaxID=43433 RepID=UPI002220D6BC|nr:Rpp20 subunit of nuclear RNase MRP and P-domain-containing protein [Tricharina praecox]KAI5842705.1 Rpp20 subunit of nuclear RNase MRP and P-domain-containing protein [Tricharina praecox]